jgi:hypothetical protein
MRKYYRDALGRFAVRPRKKRRKRLVPTAYGLADFIFYREIPESVTTPLQTLRPDPRERDRPFRPDAPKPKRQTRREEEEEDGKDVSTPEPEIKERWEDIEDILDLYIADLDLDEDIIGGS